VLLLYHMVLLKLYCKT